MPTDPPTLPDSLIAEPASALLVVGFCAEWCNTCGEFRHAFEDLSARRPAARFVWLDIEDDAQMVGDIDIENFPTIAVFTGDRLVHFGVSLPQGGILERLLDSFYATSKTFIAPSAITSLPGRLGNVTRSVESSGSA